jgi:hypothetical protein
MPVVPDEEVLASSAGTMIEAPTKPLRYEDEVLLLDNDEPTTYKEAMIGPNSIKWHDAMKSEIESMYENQVWSLIDPPDGVKPIECKWIYKKKIDADGNISVYKARLVAKGF